MSTELYANLSENIFKQYGGKETLPPESQQIIREAVERAVDDFLDERLRYPVDEETIAWIVTGKTLTYIKILSLERGLPIVGYRIVPVSLELKKGIENIFLKI